MHSTIVRKVLRFGGKTSSGDAFYCGVPGVASIGGAQPAEGDRTALAAAGFLPVNTAQQSCQRIELQGKNGLSINGIGIAPDSAIHSADISLIGADGDTERHRISPGNPLLGCLDAFDFALVTIPNAIGGFAQDATIVHWDASGTEYLGGELMGYPLRMELYYGGILPIRSYRRAPLTAHALFSIAPGGSRILRLCVDGRQRVDVYTDSSSATSTITVNAVESRKLTSAPTLDANRLIPLPLDSAGTLSTPAGGILSFAGNPMTIMSVHVAQTVSTSVVQVKVRAWD